MPAGGEPRATMSPGPASAPQDGAVYSVIMPAPMAGLERPAPSAASAHLVLPATTSLGSVAVLQALLGLAVSRPAHPAPLGTAVGRSASVPAGTRPATLPRGPVCVLLATTAPAAGNGAPLGALGLVVSSCVDASTGAPVTRPQGAATAPLASWGQTAASPVHRAASAPAVRMCADVGRGQPVTL